MYKFSKNNEFDDDDDDDDNKSNSISHFRRSHNTLCLSPQILHKHCFQFLLGLTMVPRENKNNAYAKFWGRQTKSIMEFSKVAYNSCYIDIRRINVYGKIIIIFGAFLTAVGNWFQK